MDDGYVIPGLNEDWTLGGAKLMEWCAGFMMFIVSAQLFFDNWGRSMPQLLLICVGTTFGLAGLRKTFPDEERGVRNAVMTAIGIEPPDLPAPAALQSYWSGAPLRELEEQSEFSQLGLNALFDLDEDAG